MSRVRTFVWLIALTSAAGYAFSTRAFDGPPAARRFLERQDEPLMSYRALRRLEAHNPRFKKDGWLDAWTTLDPASGFQYTIVGERGAKTIVEKVLRKALEREAEAYARHETGGAAVTADNYRFGAERDLADGLVEVDLLPRRDDALLLRGTLVVRPDDGDLVRIEGHPVKRPSFWTRRISVRRTYGRVAGVRVPLSLESTADVFVAGRSTFTMRYEYATVNGRSVGGGDAGGDSVSAPGSDGRENASQ